MPHLDSNETHGEKAKWELHKNAKCCFEQILEAALYENAVVWLLASNLTNHPSKMNKTYWAMREKQEQTYKWCSLLDSFT